MNLSVSVQRPIPLFEPWGLQIGLRRVTRYSRPGHLIPEGSRQLAGGKRSATTGEVRDPAGRMLVSSDAPQTRTFPEGRSDRRAQGAHGYCPANMTLSLCYLPWRSSARTRRRAACKTAVSVKQSSDERLGVHPDDAKRSWRR
jgi:hypothetical protein